MPWLREHLVCPADRMPLHQDGNWLISQAGRRNLWPIVIQSQDMRLQVAAIAYELMGAAR